MSKFFLGLLAFALFLKPVPATAESAGSHGTPSRAPVLAPKSGTAFAQGLFLVNGNVLQVSVNSPNVGQVRFHQRGNDILNFDIASRSQAVVQVIETDAKGKPVRRNVNATRLVLRAKGRRDRILFLDPAGKPIGIQLEFPGATPRFRSIKVTSMPSVDLKKLDPKYRGDTPPATNEILFSNGGAPAKISAFPVRIGTQNATAFVLQTANGVQALQQNFAGIYTVVNPADKRTRISLSIGATPMIVELQLDKPLAQGGRITGVKTPFTKGFAPVATLPAPWDSR